MSESPGRVVIAILGIDQHEAGALSAAAFLRDAGFEVIYLGRFNTPNQVIAAVTEEDADVIGISTHSWEYLEYVDELQVLMKEAGMDVPVVVGGSVVTPADQISLGERGVAASFGPGTRADVMIDTIRSLIR